LSLIKIDNGIYMSLKDDFSGLCKLILTFLTALLMVK